MTVNKIDADKGEVTLSFSRHDMLIIRRALQRMSSELAPDDKWLLLEIIGVDDLLRDSNFTRFLSYHRGLVKEESSLKEEKEDE